ncbi:probable NADH dehydrogenase isoform X1 [Physella acuta]|uniref:probable NADH dehydrogenase isoform X1 n=1 Tax=Physella acuta TaxID=109671 RepID=UPI0027DC7DC6|nr:probable NADH dehydrogenase isoform X1 [Physella acuta]XP_059175956.1 probable NADH dehydrogenase isoform X1 [Physella acuta]
MIKLLQLGGTSNLIILKSQSHRLFSQLHKQKLLVKYLNVTHYLQPFKRNYATSEVSKVKSESRKRLVILGTGWSSYSVLKTVNKNIYDVIVISPRNHFLFTPLLASTTVGTLEFRSIIEPVRNTGFRDSAHYHLSYATHLDTKKQEINCTSVLKPSLQYSLRYDKLVIGVGALTNTFGVPGVQENAFFLKEIADARRIRNRILNNFELSVQPNIDPKEQQRLLQIVIVGGGPTGVEFGAELYDFVEQDLVRLYRQQSKQVRVTLVESNKILSSFDTRLQAYAERKMKQRKGFNILQTTVIEVKPDSVKLKDGTSIPCALVVWSTGLAPRDFTKTLNLTKNKSGQIITDRYLRVIGESAKNIFAIGDCADIEEMSLPCTAQVAERKGRYLSKFLNSDCNEEKVGPFEFKSLGMLAYIGHFQGVSDTPQLKIKGVASWFLWRSAYLTRLGSWRLRMQVPLDWTKTILFGRDISRIE